LWGSFRPRRSRTAGAGDAGAPPTGWRCPAGHSDRSGLAAVRRGKPAVSRRFSTARRNPPWRRSL
ncbi:hypothetical protein NDU88_006000, partial [Pleurodeles waltl]